MHKKLKLVFNHGNKRVLILCGNRDIGHFSLIEKAIQQIHELFTENCISESQTVEAVNEIMARSNLKTNTQGYFSLFFLIDQLFPEQRIIMSDHLSDYIFLSRRKGEFKYYFTNVKSTPVMQLSEFLIFEYQAFKFLNFMFRRGIITRNKLHLLENSIERSTLFTGSRIEVQS